jgi:asparagine N-glycosylation enzyme membrane subunit Stt3
MVTMLVFARSANASRLTPACLGLFFSVAFVIASIRERAPHFLALAAVALLLAIVIATIGMGESGLNWMLLSLGIAAVTLGGWRLSRDLRANPIEARQ